MGELQSEHTIMTRRVQQTENDYDQAKKQWESERAMLIERCANASSLSAGSPSPNKSRRSTAQSNPGLGVPYGEGSGGGDMQQGDRDSLVIEQLEDQVRNLGQQLLKKQEAMQELLSERAGLKVRLQDAQRR